ncbi:MAG TPA: O-GlcNAc transferase, partial [Thermoanaerobaculia bacterium]|nr:O-GlcNAc transferase [Thermoanaerobaculia bacterium]
MTGRDAAPPHAARRTALAAAALVLLALAAHLPALAGGWIIDDEQYVAENRLLDDARGLATIWLEPSALPQYYPLVFTSFWLERQLFGLDPRLFHATNLLLHAAVAVLAWRVLRVLRVPAPWLVAAIFAVHPIHVDTVAWVAERKNLLSALFALVAVELYLSFDRRRAQGSAGALPVYAASLGAFALALLAKTAVAGLPVTLALVVAWRCGRRRLRELAPLVPMLALAAGLAAVTVGLESKLVGAGDRLPDPAPVERPLLAARAALFYLGKIVWPAGLSFDYGLWETAAGDAANLLPAALLAGALVAFGRLRSRWGTGPLVGLLVFLVLAAPALGFVAFYFQRYSFVADHFAYLPSLPVLALAVATADRALTSSRAGGRRVRAALAAGLLALLG